MKRKPKPELSPGLAAYHRLTNDGASSNATIRRRIALVAAERNLNPSETKALMKGRRISLFLLGQFAKKHHLHLDWLISGDLKALRETVQDRTDALPQVATTIEMQNEQWQEYVRLYGRLGNASVPIALAYLRNLAKAGAS
jgi:hypothetical protein